MSRGMHFSVDEARVLFSRLDKTARLEQDKRKTYGELEQVSRKHSPAEAIFDQQIMLLKLPKPLCNYRFCMGRKFELDRAWPTMGMSDGVPYIMTGGLAVEIQGDVHRIKQRFDSDAEKFFHALRLGWRVLPVTTRDVRSGRAAARITELLELRELSDG